MTLREEFEIEVRKAFDSNLEILFETNAQKYINWLEAKINELMINENNYLGAEKARKISSESLKKNLSEEYETKKVLEEIEEQSRKGYFQITTYDDERIRKNLTMLGYTCSKPFKDWGDIYMTVSWGE